MTTNAESDPFNACPNKGPGYIVRINSTVPIDWAVPLYGYLMPILVVITTTTNLFIVVVLSQKHLRTPTNYILLSMAVTDLLTGWTSIPWFIFYYTLSGYQIDADSGLSLVWCYSYGYFYEIFPSMFHTTTIWLTVFLAVQRYVYVCVPNSVHLYCTPRTTKLFILGCFAFAAAMMLPDVLGKDRIVEIRAGRNECKVCYADWVSRIFGLDFFYSGLSWTRAALHFTPCVLLLVFTRKLANTIKAAEVRKRSWATESFYERRGAITVDSPGRSYPTRCNASSSGRSMYATNRMLAVICLVFFLLEIPAGIINAMQVVGIQLGLSDYYFEIVNRFLIIRHLLIVLSSPIQFMIYCSMSEQFRLTARQLFTSRLLFITQAQATFHGGKRYSLILVDVETYEAKSKQMAAAKRSLAKANFFERTGSVLMSSKRKVGRQVSFPDEDSREGEKSGGGSIGRKVHYSLRQPSRKSSLSKALGKMTTIVDPLTRVTRLSNENTDEDENEQVLL